MNWLKKYFAIFAVFIALSVLFHSNLSEAQANAGDARLLYNDGNYAGMPISRYYNNISNYYDNATFTVEGYFVTWVVSKESPTEDVTVLVTESDDGRLEISCRNGNTWTKDISNIIVSVDGSTRHFDVEFEKTSGIPMVLYSTNNSGTNELAYYRKTGPGCGAGAWTGPTLLDPTVIAGRVLWVEMEARQTAGSNVIAAAFSDSSTTGGGRLQAMIWNGSSWGNESPAGSAQGWSDLSIELAGTAGANTAKVFDLAFESLSGDLLVAWGTSTGTNGINGWRYATCAGTLPCTWSPAYTPPGLGDDATNVACAPDPTSDYIACIGQGNAGNDLSAWTWTGTETGPHTGTLADATLLTISDANMHVDIDWVVNGSQRMAVGVYVETATALKYIYFDAAANAWRHNLRNSFLIDTIPTEYKYGSVQAITNPSDRTQLLVTSGEIVTYGFLWSSRLTYDGAAGGASLPLSTWTMTGYDIESEWILISSFLTQPFWVDWIRPTPYTLLYYSGVGGSLTGDTTQYVNHGANGTAVTAVANTGYTFSGWSDGVMTATRTDTNVIDNKSVTANFTTNQYTLTYSAGTGGTLTGTTPQVVNHGSNGTAVTAVANTGYTFSGWSDGVMTATRTDTNVTANKSVTANFTTNQYTLTYSAGTGGTLTGTTPQVVSHGANGTAVTANPNNGYTFSGWSDGVMTATRTDTNVIDNKSVTANFTVEGYVLQYAAGPGGTILGTELQIVNFDGNGNQVTAVPDANYYFIRWSDGLTTASRTDLNVGANKRISAIFEMLGSTKARVADSNEKITIGSSNRGLILDLPLKLKYTKSTATAGSEILTDRTPYGNDAQNYGATLSNEAASFNGTSNYVKINNVLIANPATLTISAWLKKESGGSTYECALHHGPDSSVGASAYWLGLSSADQLTATIGANTGVGWAAGQTDVVVTYGKWYHLLATWDGSIVRVYVDGVFNKQYNLASYTNVSAPTRMGASTDGTAYQLRGEVANVRIYNASLDANQVQALYSQGLDDATFILRGQD